MSFPLVGSKFRQHWPVACTFSTTNTIAQQLGLRSSSPSWSWQPYQTESQGCTARTRGRKKRRAAFCTRHSRKISNPPVCVTSPNLVRCDPSSSLRAFIRWLGPLHPDTRLGNARRVWPPTHMQVAQPSLGVAALVNGGRFRARASFRDMIKRRGAIGGGGGGADDEKDDAVSKLIDKYGDQMGEVGFGGLVGFCRCVFFFGVHVCLHADVN